MDRFTQVAAAVLGFVGMLFVVVSVVLAPGHVALANPPPQCVIGSCNNGGCVTPPCDETIITGPRCHQHTLPTTCKDCKCQPEDGICECRP